MLRGASFLLLNTPIYTYVYATSRMLEGMNAKNTSTTNRQIGRSNNMKGGGGNGGSMSGKTSNEAVRQISMNNDSKLK